MSFISRILQAVSVTPRLVERSIMPGTFPGTEHLYRNVEERLDRFERIASVGSLSEAEQMAQAIKNSRLTADEEYAKRLHAELNCPSASTSIAVGNTNRSLSEAEQMAQAIKNSRLTADEEYATQLHAELNSPSASSSTATRHSVPIRNLSQREFDALKPIDQIKYLTHQNILPKSVVQNSGRTRLDFVYEDSGKYDLGVSDTIQIPATDWNIITKHKLLPAQYKDKQPIEIVDFTPRVTTVPGGRTIRENLRTVVGYKMDL